MALNSDATLVPGAGNYFTGPVGMDKPDDLAAPNTGNTAPNIWSNMGHTSLEDILAMESEGGEATVLGTLQSPTLRTTYSPRTEAFKFTIQQFDKDSVKLFFGSNMIDVDGDGKWLGIHKSPTPTIASFLVIFTDGDRHFAFYAPKAEIFRGDDLSMGSNEELAGLPLKVTPVIHSTNDWAYAITPLGVVTP